MTSEEIASYKEMVARLQKMLKAKRAPKAIITRVDDVLLAIEWLEKKR